jgi:hypothetical protein
VRRDDLVTFHVDGTHGSAVAGLQDCRAQPRDNTPRPVWNPDVKQTMNFFEQWQEVPDTEVYDNGFKIQWEAFIRHVAEDAPYRWTLPEGAKGVQLVEAALQSWKERRWVDVPRWRLRGATASPSPPCPGSITLPAADGRLRPHTRCAARGAFGAAPPAPPSTASPIRPPTWWPTRAASTPGCNAPSTGTPPSPTASACGAGPGRGRGDGHRAARHGPGLADLAGADPPLASTPRATCPAPGGQRLRHRPPGARAARTVDDVIRAYEEQMEAIEALGGR